MRRTAPLIALVVLGVAALLAWTTCGGTDATRDGESPDAAAGGAVPPKAAADDPSPTRAPDRPARPRAARPGETVETPVPAVAGELPADALGAGPCELRLNLVDDATGAPVAARVRLWRLGVPQDARWTAGDHVQKNGDVPAEGVRWESLPAGRYFVQVDAQRRDAPPLEIVALDGAASVTARLQMPRKFPVRVLVYDAFGGRIDDARLTGGPGWASTTRSPEVPASLSPRRPRRPSGVEPSVLLGGRGGRAWNSGGGEVKVGGPDGFELGTIVEASRELELRRSWTLTFSDGSVVDVSATATEAGKGTYVGFTAPVAPLVTGVRTPDGRLATDAGARSSARCQAVLRGPADGPDRWRDARVEVRVALNGYEDAKFEHRLGDPPPQIVLTPAAPPKK